jgi:hypothetical protein
MHGLSLGAQFMNGHFSWGRLKHSHHTHHSHHSERAGHHNHNAVPQVEDNSCDGNVTMQGSVKQAMVQQIGITLTQHFELHQTSVTVAGATADEQAANDLSNAVSSALNSMSDTPPTDAVVAVNDVATGAILQTAQSLPQSTSDTVGGSASELDSAISQITSQLQALYSAFLDNANAASTGSSVTMAGAKLINNAKGVLEIHTQEGDIVTLQFTSKSGLSVQSLQASNDNLQVDSSNLQAFSKNRVTINVQGDLNSAELQAIQDLVDQVNQLADGFFGGSNDAVTPQTNGLNIDNSQLADYSLQMALKQTFEAYGLDLSLQPAANSDQTQSALSDAAAITTGGSQATDSVSAQDGTTAATTLAGDTSNTTVDPAIADSSAIDSAKISVAA